MRAKKSIGTLLGLALALAASPAGAAAGVWLPAANLSEPGRPASEPAVAMSPAGDTVAAWQRQSAKGPEVLLQVATRQPGGSFSAPVTLGSDETRPDVAVTPSGEAFVAWWRFENSPPGFSALELATRPPGAAAFSPPQRIASLPPEAIPQGEELAVNAAGDVALAWLTRDPTSPVDPSAELVEATARMSGEPEFAPPEAISPEVEKEGERSGSPAIAIDAVGTVTAAWFHKGGAGTVVEAATRTRGGHFGEAVEVNPPLAAGEDALQPDIAVDAVGHVAVAWLLHTPTEQAVEVSDRAGAASFGAPQTVSNLAEPSFLPQIETSPGGATTVLWEAADGVDSIVQAARRSQAAEPFAPAQSLSEPIGGAAAPRLSVGQDGSAAAVWVGSNGVEPVVEASLAPTSGPFASPAEISAPGETFHPAVSVGDGDTTVVWPRFDGQNRIVQFAGYDATGPRLDAVSIPLRAVAGTPVGLSAIPTGVWPVGQASFAFGDGGFATGNSVSHVYPARGAFRVDVWAVDVAGIRVQTATTIYVDPAVPRIRIGKLRLNRRKGTAKLAVTVPSAGRLGLNGDGLLADRAKAAGPGTVWLRVRANRLWRRSLRSRGRLEVRMRVTFTADGGGSSYAYRKATLVLRKGKRRGRR